jgi:hypothetical protein
MRFEGLTNFHIDGERAREGHSLERKGVLGRQKRQLQPHPWVPKMARTRVGKGLFSIYEITTYLIHGSPVLVIGIIEAEEVR